MVIPLSDIQTLVGIDDHNKQTVILSDELNTLRRATNATIIRAGQQGTSVVGKQQQQQPLVGQQQHNQLGQPQHTQLGLQQSHANVGQMTVGQQGHIVAQQQPTHHQPQLGGSKSYNSDYLGCSPVSNDFYATLN